MGGHYSPAALTSRGPAAAAADAEAITVKVKWVAITHARRSQVAGQPLMRLLEAGRLL
jgi:hypothetical protein